MPNSIISVKGCVTKINPTDNVLGDSVTPCPFCGNAEQSNREIRGAGFCGKGLYCLACNKCIGEII